MQMEQIKFCIEIEQNVSFNFELIIYSYISH